MARIRVVDTGAGISAQALPKLFDSFSQMDSSTTPLGGAPHPDSKQPVDQANKPSHRKLAGIRILLVDDDRDIGEVLELVLEAQGAVVSVVHSTAEALASLTQSMPDVLVSDLAMPGRSGYDLMRTLVAREGKNAPPAAALSAFARGLDRDEALASGFRMLLEKPIDPSVLIAAIATLAETGGHTPTQLSVEGRRRG